jgi:CBS domain-containing protein
MNNDEHINDELSIASDRLDEPRKILDQVMIKEPISRLTPRQPAICVEVGTKMSVAIELMRTENVGSVLVTEDEKLIGIITDRDILCKVTAVHGNPDRLRVEEIMTVGPETLKITDPIVFALNKMGVGGFRHVPLVDEEYRAIGIISVIHVVRYVVDFFAREVMNLPPEPGMDIGQSREGA